MARQVPSTSKPSTKTVVTIEQQIPLNAVLEMMQRMTGAPPPPYEPRDRGTKAARAANRKKKSRNLPLTPTTSQPQPSTSRRTVTSATVSVSETSNPAHPAMSFEFPFGHVQGAEAAPATPPSTASIPARGGRRNRNRHRSHVTVEASATVSAADLRSIVDPILEAAAGLGLANTQQEEAQAEEPAAQEKKEPPVDPVEEEAQKIWERVSDPMCHCRKKRMLERLQKHIENLRHVNALLKARVMAYQAFGDQMTSELESRGLGIVLVVTEMPDGQTDLRFKIEKKPTEVVAKK